MKKAANINELANNLIPGNYLRPEDKDVYVPIYQDTLEMLRNMIVNDQVESQTFFAAGQAGTGKTTALNFLKTDKLEQNYHVKYISMSDYLEISDVDIIDFLLAFAFAMVKDSPIEDKYYEQLEDLQKKYEGDAVKTAETETIKKKGAGTEAEASIGGGFFNFATLKARFFSYWKMDTSYREYTRNVFNLKKPLLHKLVNELLDDYVEKVSKEKKLLVIIDDLDKLQEVSQINSIFIKHRNYIFKLRCKKIISIPTYLTKAPEIIKYSQYPIQQFILRLTSNPFDKKKRAGEEKKIAENRRLLRQVIQSRIADGHPLIDENALEEAVNSCGGIIRQLIRIVYVASVNVRVREGEKISRDDIVKAIALLRNEMAWTILSLLKIKLLNTVLTLNVPVSETAVEFVELLLANNVLAYDNGDPWYRVNPLISRTVKIYASRQNQS